MKAACTVLEASQGDRFSEAKLQKALAKLEKVENPLMPQLTAAAAAPLAGSAAKSQGQAPDIERPPGPADVAQHPVSLSLVVSCPGLCNTDVCLVSTAGHTHAEAAMIRSTPENSQQGDRPLVFCAGRA